ncbi:transcriptional regulator family: Fungal Specific TF [Penicillium roqueforti]|nr:transcriptional regulator family: Fungal Specific TF [Penicillium roqueforti]KAI3246146.1 transcriptional regulator family: Fungal Specific TF [Penicillium roqueforti]
MDDSRKGRRWRHPVPQELRKRATRACIACRKAKEKCEDGRPCSRCSRFGQQCIFEAAHSDRRFREEFDRTDERERIHWMELLLKHYVPNISLELQSLRERALEISKSSTTGQVKSGQSNEIMSIGLAEDTEFAISPQSNTTTQYAGELSYVSLSMRMQQVIHQSLRNTLPEVYEPTDLFGDQWSAHPLQSETGLISSSLECLPPRDVAEFLINSFFNYAQTNDFYVEQSQLCETLNLCYSYSAQMQLPHPDASSVCVLLMTLAIGTRFAHMGSPWCVRSDRKIQSVPDHKGGTQFSEDELGLKFYRFASKLLPLIIASASLRTVQACLLMGTYFIHIDASGLSFTYLGLALRMAVQNGMHRRYTGHDLDTETIEIRNRVFWTTYSLERRIGILHGKPTSLNVAEVDAAFPTNIPSLRPANDPSNFSNMITSICLTSNLANFATEIASLRKASTDHKKQCLDNLLSQRESFLAWWASLPNGGLCRDLGPSSGYFRTTIHLQLDCCLIRIFLGWYPLIERVTTSFFHNPEAVDIEDDLPGKSILEADCVKASFEVVNLCTLLDDKIGLARVSFTEFSACRAALLAILAQSISTRTAKLRNALSTGLRLFGVMSMGVGSAPSVVACIESLQKSLHHRMGHSPGKMSTEDLGYDLFKTWVNDWGTEAASIGARASNTSHYTSRATNHNQGDGVLSNGNGQVNVVFSITVYPRSKITIENWDPPAHGANPLPTQKMEIVRHPTKIGGSLKIDFEDVYLRPKQRNETDFILTNAEMERFAYLTEHILSAY